MCSIAFCLILVANSCKDDFPAPIETIYVVNKADHNIESTVPHNDGPFYPDTTLSEILAGSMQNTPPGRNAYYDHHGTGSLAELLESTPEGLITVYLFHPDTLAIYSDQEIMDDYKVLARYDLSLTNLETLDFFVPYPPSEVMDSMQVYLPQ